jgi:serine/threonine-protein kinase
VDHRTSPAFLCVPFALSIGLVSGGARAGDETLAEALFREGTALMQSGDYARACPKLAESYRQDPATGALLALALCQERSGQLASAWATYSSVVGLALQDARPDRVEAARRHAAALEPRLSKLIVEVPAEVGALPGFSVKRDGVPLPQAAWGSAMPVDPGEHSVEAIAERRAPWKQSVTLDTEASVETVRVPPLAPANEGPPPPDARRPKEKPRPVDVTVSPPRTMRLRTVAPWVGGAGIVALGVGTFFGLRAMSLNEQSRASGHCDATGCDDTGLPLNHQALTAARIATGLFIAGGALVAGGVTLYFAGGSGASSASASLRVSPAIADGGVGLVACGGL